MVFRRSSRNERARPPRGAPRTKLAASLAPVLGLLAFAGAAHAQTGISLNPDGAQVLPAAAAVQASQAVQAAAAQAATVQQAPTNIAIQIIVNSPGSNPVITQTNSAASDAAAGNTSSTTQAAGQQQGTQGTPSGGGTAAAVGQSSSTAQNAASQATTQQGGATNVSVVTVVGSPSAAPAVSQTNSAASGATAANTSSTTQVAGQTPAGADAQQSAQPDDAQPAGGALPSQSQPVGTSTQQGLGNILAGPTPGSSILTWISSWDWIWTAAPLPSLPSLPELEILLPGGIPLPGGLPGVPLPDLDGSADGKGAPARADARDGKRAGDRSEAWLPVWSIQPPFPSLFGAATGSGGPDPSASFVQRRSGAGTIARTQLRPSERPPASPGTFAGGGSAAAAFGTSGLILGALLLIALQHVSAATALSRRFDLASAAWRRQAYLSPLERPG